MLRVLTLSTLFPTSVRPTNGLFVEQQTLSLAALPGVELEVVSPVAMPLWPLSFHRHYRDNIELPIRECWKGVTIHRPRFRVWPKLTRDAWARVMAQALLPVLREVRARFPFDVLAAEFFWPDGWAAMALAEALDLPFSIKARGNDIDGWDGQFKIRGQMKEAALAADGLLAVSESLREFMATLGIPRERVRVHYTGVDRELFRPVDRSSAKAALGIEGPLLATVGWLVPIKGQRLTLAALEVIPGAVLFVIGNGPDRGALEAQVRDRSLTGRVRFLGNCLHEELPKLLAAADVVVQPSEREGLSNVWVEALACGTPIVTSDVGAAREVIDRAEAGSVVAREPKAIAAAVKAILADPPAQVAVRAAAERFSWKRNSRELYEHLSALARN